MKSLYPLFFEPVYQQYVWGGDRIARRFNRDLPEGVYAESWEVSDRTEGMSVVANGPLKGMPLADLIRDYGRDLLGTDSDEARFPLLVKLIDARETLSVQVHPNDERAAACGGEAKTEMWYVLEADPSARVYAGVRPGVDEVKFRDAMEQGALEDLLHVEPVQAGDAIFMPGGRVHAIGAGCLLLEVQQNSNTTYRLYDWGRVGADGKPRDLHIDQAMQVIRWHDEDRVKMRPRRLGLIEKNELWEVLTCSHFRMERLLIREPWPAGHDGRSFQVLFCADAPVRIRAENGSQDLVSGGTCLIPASVTRYTVEPLGAPATLLRITRP